MANLISGKWEKITEQCYGDFQKKTDGPFYGCIQENNTYRIGGFNKDKKPDGSSLFVHGSFALFAKYKDGVMLYPYITIEHNGDSYIALKKENGITTYLHLQTNKSNFELYRLDEEDERIGYSISYDALTCTFKFNKYVNGDSVGEAKVAKKFMLTNPIVDKHEFDLPTKINFDEIREVAESDKFCAYHFLPKEGIGVGIDTFPNGHTSIGGCTRDIRKGYQMFQFDDYFMVFYADGVNFDGIKIQVDDSGEIFINVLKTVDDNKKRSSAIIWINGDEVTLCDSTTGSVEENAPRCRIRNMEEISFSMNGKFFTDYYYADHLYDDIEDAKAEEKKPLPMPEAKPQGKVIPERPKISDPNDPEYKMMSLIGQEDAKKEFARIRAYIQKNDASHVYKNIVFFGENGVGKSTVGRLITKVLYKYKAIRDDHYLEKNAKEIFNNFTGSTAENLDNLLKMGRDGVILIDDMHYLDALNSSNVNEGLFALAKIMEANPETVFILCDNKYNMNQILENNRDSFQRMIRFKVNFKDFTRDELKQILNIKAKEKGYVIKDEAMDKLLEIIFLSKSYGNNINASAAISILEEIIVIQNVRTEFIDDKTITKDDVDVYVVENDIAFIDQKTGFQSEARKKLDELVGLEKIKETVDDLIAYFSINRGKKVDFHMCFSGNPGTGKTEVARIIGKLLRQEGILGTTKFIEVTRRDLVGQYIGQSAIMTRDIIDKAMGGVLYIDEAYSLAYGGEKDYGAEVVAELLKAMEDRRGEFCVILAGYTNEMRHLFDLNPGFKSRIKFDLEFPDYSDEELEKIARLFLKRDNIYMTDENIKFLVKIVSVQRNFPNFANVRTLREAISRVQIKHAGRVRGLRDDDAVNELTYDDVIGAFTKEEIDFALHFDEEEETVPKLNPQILRDLYQGYKPEPFAKTQDYLSEAILALKMSEGKNGEGTGFMISKDGYFLTCGHCVDGAGKIVARRRISHHGRYIDINYDSVVISVDKKADVALCQVIADEKEEFEYLTLDDGMNEPEKLSKVYLLGYPFGVTRFDEMSANEGKVMSYQKANQWMLDQINLDIQAKGGNSGSPVIDAETSKVIGVFCGSSISRGQSVTEEINYGRPIKYVWNMLEKEYKEKN